MDKHADLIDTLACTLLGSASIGGVAWLVENMGSYWPLSFAG